jgi:hypothetical protein
MEAVNNLAASVKAYYNVTIASMRCLLVLICTGALIVTGCSRKQVLVPTPAPANGLAKSDNSYFDLQPGSTVRIVLPVLKPGGATSSAVTQAVHGNTISVSAPNLIGYDTAHYAVKGKKDGPVILKITSAEETIAGKAAEMAVAPTLPFELPQKPEHVRLIYLVRVSQADHNMAIAAAKRMQTLEAFTKRLREDPTACTISRDVFCSWVPAGVAVRPENP